MERAKYRCTLAVGVGEEEGRLSSMPQGCPWSMLFLSVQLMPWVRQMRQLAPSVLVRLLADD
eukprot:8494284-Alexandrium_andersonii.AAC.1